MVNLQKPYAVIRKAVGETSGTALEGDISDEEAALEEEGPTASVKKRKVDKTPNGHGKDKGRAMDEGEEGEEEEDEPPLFAPEPGIFPATPSSDDGPASSSPFYPSSAPRDYSSDLDPGSSPAKWDQEDEEDVEAEVEKLRIAEEKRKRDKAREKRKRDQKERTRHYEVVGIVRKKVVFALRCVTTASDRSFHADTPDQSQL